jgi:hypothetical protein
MEIFTVKLGTGRAIHAMVDGAQHKDANDEPR